ncbi:sepiapterin reductase family protein [Martiniozyma asiatica (nom. inval.)]|nr:sepiapterin reductase family protein [Martiniozyma asiatica]
MVPEKCKNIIVTGASRGLGRAIVHLLISTNENVNVTAIARDEAALKDLLNSLTEEQRNRILIEVGDVTDSSTIEKSINNTINKWGSVNGVIFNAGVLAPVGHLYDSDYKVDDMKSLFDVNFFSIVKFTNLLLNTLKLTPGLNDPSKCLDIVVVSSGASVKAYDGWLAYGASKASVNSFCMHLHEELFPLVRAVAVAPGVVDTDMQSDIRNKFGSNMKSDAIERFTKLHTDNLLLDPFVVGKVYADLVVKGIPETISGSYVRWNEI